MKIYIMRHGEAGFNALSDQLRELTEFGQSQVMLVTDKLKKHNQEIEVLFVSPYIRAKQTAEIIKTKIKFKQEEIFKSLMPSGNEQSIKSKLDMLKDEGINSVMIVSHLPLVGNLVSSLCSNTEPPFFNTSDVACIYYDHNFSGKLEGIIHYHE